MFLVSGRRRVLHVNAAWERLTGVPLIEIRGGICRQRAALDRDFRDQVLAALMPPAEAFAGRPCQVRRRAPGKKLAWWEIDFFPWSDAAGPLAILGKIRTIQEDAPPHAALPEKLVQLRSRTNQAFHLESWPGEAPATQRLVSQLRLAAETRVPALLQGPPGSGKTWAARTIHQLGSSAEKFFRSPERPAR
jgi:transcriptional regulator with PAS, ATPase and Fis domain